MCLHGQARQSPPVERACRCCRRKTSSCASSSPSRGLAASCVPRAGETTPAGGAVVSLLPPENIFVRFFVPEPRLAEVHIGDRVRLLFCRWPAQPRTLLSSLSAPTANTS